MKFCACAVSNRFNQTVFPSIPLLFLSLNLTVYHEDYAGDIGPFQLAIALTALSMVVIFFWRENYGQRGKTSSERVFIQPFF